MRDQYDIDEQFINQAWGEMEQLLDQEMPVRRKRRGLIIWWFSAAMAATLALFLIYTNVFPNAANELAETEMLSINTTKPTNLEQADEIKNGTAINNSINTNPIIENSAREVPNPLAKEKIARTPSSEQAVRTDELVAAKTEKDKESILIYFEDRSAPPKEVLEQKTIQSKLETSVPNSVEKKEELLKNERSLIQITDDLATKAVELLEQYSLPPNVELKTSKPPKTAYWQHGISLAWQQYFNPTFDAQAVYLAHLNHRKWRISSGIGLALSDTWEKTKLEAVTFSEMLDLDMPEIERFDTTVIGATGGMDTLSSAKKAISMIVPLSIRYRIQRFSIFGQGQLSYILDRNASRTMDLAMNTTARNPIELAPKWQFQIGLGVGYALGQKWSLDLSYQQKIKTSEQAVQLGVHYYFH